MEGSGENSTVFTWKKCRGSCKRRQCLFLQAVSAPCQADPFGASRSAPWAVTFFWGLLSYAGLRNCLDLWFITPTAL